MQTSIIIIIGGLLLIGFFIWRIKQRRDFGFWDVVKNPELWGDLIVGSNEAGQKIIEAQSWSEDRLAKELENYLFKSQTRRASLATARAFEELGSKAEPHILRIMADESRRKQLLTPTHLGDNNSLPETPFERACEILKRDPSEEAVPLLASFQNDSNSAVRKEAVLVIATVGTPEIIPHVRKALKDEDDFVRSYTVMGLNWAIKKSRLSDQCRRELFHDLEPQLDGEWYSNEAAELMFDLDANRATQFFLSDETLAAGPEKLQSVFKVLADRGIEVPRDRLNQIIEARVTNYQQDPQPYMLGEALRLLGAHKNISDRPRLEEFLSHPDKKVAEGAAEGLLAFHDLTGFEDSVWRKRESGGETSLSVPQKNWIAVQEFDGEVNNGGVGTVFLQFQR